MRKYVKLPIRLERKQYDEITCFEISFTREAIGDWFLELSQLKEGLIDALIIEPAEGKFKLELQAAPPGGFVEKIPGSLRDERVVLELPPYTLHYLLVFSLKYYRDGYAEVDHIDLEASFKDLGEDVDIMLKFTDAAPPLSPEEAKNILGH